VATNIGELRREAGVYEARSVWRSTDRAVFWSGNGEWGCVCASGRGDPCKQRRSRLCAESTERHRLPVRIPRRVPWRERPNAPTPRADTFGKAAFRDAQPTFQLLAAPDARIAPGLARGAVRRTRRRHL